MLSSLFQKGQIPITVILHKMKQESLSLSFPGKKNVKKSWKMSVPELAEEWIDLFLLLFCE